MPFESNIFEQKKNLVFDISIGKLISNCKSKVSNSGLREFPSTKILDLYFISDLEKDNFLDNTIILEAQDRIAF